MKSPGPGTAQAGVGAPTPSAQTWVLSTVQICSREEAKPRNMCWGAEQRWSMSTLDGELLTGSRALEGETCHESAQGEGKRLLLGHSPQAKVLVGDKLAFQGRVVMHFMLHLHHSHLYLRWFITSIASRRWQDPLR